MMKSVIFLCLVALWEVASVTAEESIDPRANPAIDNHLKESARYHCYYRCHRNPDDCSNDARRDLATCESLLYWVYFTNYETCRARCDNVAHIEEFKEYVDCERTCLRIAEDKVRTSSKTPDELIHAYFDNRREGKTNVYIGE